MPPETPLPRSAEFMTPTFQGVKCEVCGKAIGAEPARITSYPNAVHERCRDRYYQEFPYGEDLQKLRRLAKSLILGYRLVVDEGKWLAAAARDWPKSKEEILKAWPERRANAKVRLTALLGSLRGM